MLFADDLVLRDESRGRMEERLKNWRRCLEHAGLKLSRSKIEHFPPQKNTDKIKRRLYGKDETMELPTNLLFVPGIKNRSRWMV